MDNAFKVRPFNGFTVSELRALVAAGEACDKIKAEIIRREAVAAGVVSVMTDGERLRFAQRGKA